MDFTGKRDCCNCIWVDQCGGDSEYPCEDYSPADDSLEVEQYIADVRMDIDDYYASVREEV